MQLVSIGFEPNELLRRLLPPIIIIIGNIIEYDESPGGIGASPGAIGASPGVIGASGGTDGRAPRGATSGMTAGADSVSCRSDASGLPQ